MKNSALPTFTPRSRGFSLVELMVALVIGLVTTLVITQVLAFAEGQKRTTTSGSDAQVNGALALYALQRDVQMAGYGFASSPEFLGCPIHAKFNGADVATGAATPKFPTALIPVVIDATDPERNSVRVISSSKQSYSIPTRILPPNYDPADAAKKLIFPVNATLGVQNGDLMLAVKDASTSCEVFRVTSQPAVAGQVDRADAAAGWNPAGFPTATYGNGDALVNLGSLIDSTYSVSANGTLQQTRFTLDPATGEPAYDAAPVDMFPNVVVLRALYGKDTDGNGIVDKYDQTTPTTNAEWLQVLTVRIAIVARSTQYERDEVTTANPSWDVGTTPVSVVPAPTVCGSSKCLELKVDGLTNWKHYRYKVFDTVIPLRNQLWHS
jgi:type IV pilus assembly protein PilW